MQLKKKTNFTLEKFTEAKKTSKTIVINSWNKYCGTCAKQVKILKQAEKDFPNALFLYYEQNKNEDSNIYNKNILVMDKKNNILGIATLDESFEIKPKVVFNAIG